jgi:magnesium-transporting ATPase (P-type)
MNLSKIITIVLLRLHVVTSFAPPHSSYTVAAAATGNRGSTNRHRIKHNNHQEDILFLLYSKKSKKTSFSVEQQLDEDISITRITESEERQEQEDFPSKRSLVRANRGLTQDEVREKLEIYGENVLTPPKEKSWVELCIQQFDDRLVQILLVVATISTASSLSQAIGSDQQSMTSETMLELFVEPFIILLILMLNAGVGVWQQLSAINSLEALKKLQPKLTTVLRQNKQGIDEWFTDVDASQLVPGDLIKVKVGDMVPADAYVCDLLSSAVLSVDESALSGESVSVEKEVMGSNNRSSRWNTTVDGDDAYDSKPVNEQKSTLFASTMITKGNAEAIVTKTGALTEIGKIQKGIVSAESVKTPLNERLDKFGDDLALLIAGICVAVWLISIPRFDDPSFTSIFEGAVYYTKVAVSLGVAAIPEGLPAVITLVLALGTRRLAERNVIGECWYC